MHTSTEVASLERLSTLSGCKLQVGVAYTLLIICGTKTQSNFIASMLGGGKSTTCNEINFKGEQTVGEMFMDI